MANREAFWNELMQKNNIVLSAGQQAAGEQILNFIERPHRQDQTVIVTGLSGIGKSTLLNTISSTLHRRDARVVGMDEIEDTNMQMNDEVMQAILNHNNSIVFDLTPLELKRFSRAQKTIFDSADVVRVKGLTKAESVAYVEKKYPYLDPLRKSRILLCCMGIPLLIDRAAHFNLNEKELTSAMAHYLYQAIARLGIKRPIDLKGVLHDYVELLPVQAVIDIAQAYCNETDFLDLGLETDVFQLGFEKVLKRYMDLQEQGVFQETIDVVDHKVFELYNALYNKLHGSVEIIAFGLTSDQYHHVLQMLGMESKGGLSRNLKNGFSVGARPQLFFIDDRKKNMLMRNEMGDIVYFDESSDEPMTSGGYRQRFVDKLEETQVRFASLKDNGSNCGIVFQCHDHQSKSTIRSAWMMESLFQQLCIPYYANLQNGIYAYIFDPSQGKIIMLEKPIE